MSLPTLTVKIDNPVGGHGGTFLLDGHDISGGLVGFDISYDVDKVTTATLRLLVGAIDMATPLAHDEAATPEPEPQAAAIEPPELRCFGEEPAHA